MTYYKPGIFFAGAEAFKSALTRLGFVAFPRVLINHQFLDKVRMLRNPEGQPHRADSPIMATNMDNFGRTKLVPPKPYVKTENRTRRRLRSFVNSRGNPLRLHHILVDGREWDAFLRARNPPSSSSMPSAICQGHFDEGLFRERCR